MPVDASTTCSPPIRSLPNVAGRRMPRTLVALFACASGLSVANVYYAQPLLDALAADFGIGHAAIGGVVTATQVGCALALLLLVPLGDRMERRRLMLVQLAVLTLALLGVAVAASSPALLLGMLAVGLLGTAMTQGLIAYAATTAAAAERGRVVGAAQGGVVIGLLLVRVLAGLVADLAGWRAVYLCSALLMLGLAAVLWRVLPVQAMPAQRLPYAQLLRSMVTLLRHERVLQIRGVIALLVFAAFNIFWSALVLPLSAPPFALSHTLIGAFGLVGAVGALAAARAGHWADRSQGQRTTGLALALLLLSWWPLSALSSSVVAGAGRGRARSRRPGRPRHQPELDLQQPDADAVTQPPGGLLHAVLRGGQRARRHGIHRGLCGARLDRCVPVGCRGQCPGPGVLGAEPARDAAGGRRTLKARSARDRARHRTGVIR